ncbi:MAG TPA: hypothetical protein VG099_27480, partial [Gemmataceae bacterium]|nr:hypothetical protein [Gemmataceae bacterium]
MGAAVRLLVSMRIGTVGSMLSRPARFVIGGFAILTGCFFCVPLLGVVLAPPLPTELWPFVGLGAACLVVAVACFVPRT